MTCLERSRNWHAVLGHTQPALVSTVTPSCSSAAQPEGDVASSLEVLALGVLGDAACGGACNGSVHSCSSCSACGKAQLTTRPRTA